MQGTNALQIAAKKWARLLNNRTLELYDSQSSTVVFDSLDLGDAVRIAPGRTLFYVSTTSGQRVELGHSEPEEINRWVRALSECRKRSENFQEDRKRKRIESEDLQKPEASMKNGSRHSENEAQSVVNSSSTQENHQNIGIDANGADACNVLQEIAGSNLSEDEYDPEEDSMELERARQQTMVAARSNDTDIQSDIKFDENVDRQPRETRTNSSTPVPEHSPTVNTARENAPSWPRAFISFDDGAFTLRDRPALKVFFERYGEVVDVYLPSFNRKVIERTVLRERFSAHHLLMT